MGLVVQKFGGSSVADADRVKNVAKIVAGVADEGNQVVVVVSAQGDTTDELIEKASEISRSPSKRELDMLMSSGEQVSASLLAMALQEMGHSAISLTGWQAGFVTNSNYGIARIRSINTERLHNELSRGNIVIVAGFQGLNRYEDITTLGRGGSDTSAVALAASLGADLCQIYTDVTGVYTADPRLVHTAVKLDEISFDEMLELASLGAQVLHNRSVEMAKKYNVNLEVLSSLENKPGTIVREVVKMEHMLIRGVAKDENVARITVLAVPDQPGIAYKIFSLLAKEKINVDIILQTMSEETDTKDISFTVARGDKENAMAVLREMLPSLGGKDVTADDSIAKISIVGAGMQSNFGVAAKMFEALAGVDVNIQMISTSEIKISVVIAAEDVDRAMTAVHDAFIPPAEQN